MRRVFEECPEDASTFGKWGATIVCGSDTVFHVSPDGDDETGDGSEVKPFATPKGCVKWIEANVVAMPGVAVTIKLKPGTYASAEFSYCMFNLVIEGENDPNSTPESGWSIIDNPEAECLLDFYQCSCVEIGKIAFKDNKSSQGEMAGTSIVMGCGTVIKLRDCKFFGESCCGVRILDQSCLQCDRLSIDASMKTPFYLTDFSKIHVEDLTLNNSPQFDSFIHARRFTYSEVNNVKGAGSVSGYFFDNMLESHCQVDGYLLDQITSVNQVTEGIFASARIFYKRDD